MNQAFIIFLFLISLLLVGCTEDDASLHVDADLVPHFEEFQAQAAKRGITVDFSTYDVEGYIDAITSEGVVGQCSHTEESPNRVTISPVFWANSTDMKKELVIFHELGHCYLQRSHIDTKDNNGNCLSIMHSSASACNIDYEENRETFLDELFSY